MTNFPTLFSTWLMRYPKLPVASYCALLFACVATIVYSINHVLQRYDAYGDALSRLARLQQRPAPTAQNSGVAPPGSALIEGNTATIASAALLQRVTAAVSGAGGSIISSEVEQGAARSKDGYLKVVMNFEAPHEVLQRVLHDLEAGMPFLFV